MYYMNRPHTEMVLLFQYGAGSYEAMTSFDMAGDSCLETFLLKLYKRVST